LLECAALFEFFSAAARTWVITTCFSLAHG
jgi:hypothetical protein